MAFAAFCALCAFLSKPGHFDVNGCSDECASFYKVLHCLRGVGGGVGGWKDGHCFYLCSVHT